MMTALEEATAKQIETWITLNFPGKDAVQDAFRSQNGRDVCEVLEDWDDCVADLSLLNRMTKKKLRRGFTGLKQNGFHPLPGVQHAVPATQTAPLQTALDGQTHGVAGVVHAATTPLATVSPVISPCFNVSINTPDQSKAHAAASNVVLLQHQLLVAKALQLHNEEHKSQETAFVREATITTPTGRTSGYQLVCGACETFSGFDPSKNSGRCPMWRHCTKHVYTKTHQDKYMRINGNEPTHKHIHTDTYTHTRTHTHTHRTRLRLPEEYPARRHVDRGGFAHRRRISG